MRNGPTLPIEDIHEGVIYSFEHTFTRHDEELFAAMTKDSSAVTMENDTEPIVHGMLAASFFSTLVDTYCPGPYCLYLSQTLKFRKLLKYGEQVVVRGTVIAKSESTRVLTLRTEMLRGNEVIIDGEAKVRLL